MASALPSNVVVSAPGKVFLAGGYLVLDRRYQALVFGLDARIHVHVAPAAEEQGSGVGSGSVVVRSPQFVDAEWRYQWMQAEDGGGILFTQVGL